MIKKTNNDNYTPATSKCKQRYVKEEEIMSIEEWCKAAEELF